MNIIIKCAMKFNSRVVTLLVLFVRVTFVFGSKIYLLSVFHFLWMHAYKIIGLTVTIVH